MAKKKKRIGARTIGYCARRIYLDLVRAPQLPLNDAVRKIFREGRIVEDMAILYLKEAMGLDVVGQQRSLIFEDTVSGKIDGCYGQVAIRPSGGVVEIKSAATRKFKRMVKSRDFSEYLDQPYFYADEGEFEKILLFVVDRDTSIAQGFIKDPLIVPLAPNPERVQYLKNRALELMAGAGNDEIPPAEMTPDDIQCFFCPHSVTCSIIGR